MARSSKQPGEKPNAEDIPKGMMAFEVTGATIRDNLGDYCEKGDWAVLNKGTATAYLKKNLIKVEMPDFGDEDDTESADEGGTETSDAAVTDSSTEGDESASKPKSRKSAGRVSQTTASKAD